MKDKIEVAPAPIVLGTIDISQGPLSSASRTKLTRKTSRKPLLATQASIKMMNKTQRSFGRQADASKLSLLLNTTLGGENVVDDGRSELINDDDDTRSKKSFSVYSSTKRSRIGAANTLRKRRSPSNNNSTLSKMSTTKRQRQ